MDISETYKHYAEYEKRSRGIEFQEYRITFVRSIGAIDCCWLVYTSNGWHFTVLDHICRTPPAVGETMRVYSQGIGYAVKGLEIGGRKYK